MKHLPTISELHDTFLMSRFVDSLELYSFAILPVEDNPSPGLCKFVASVLFSMV